MADISCFLRDPEKHPFDTQSATVADGRIRLLLLPLECTLGLLSRLDEPETASTFSRSAACNVLTSSPRDALTYRLAGATVLHRAIESGNRRLHDLACLAFARHCLGTTFSGPRGNVLLRTFDTCQRLRQNAVKWFEADLDRFEAECDRRWENLSFVEESPFATNFVLFFFGDTSSEEVEALGSSSGSLKETLDSWRLEMGKVLEDLDRVQVSLAGMQTKTMWCREGRHLLAPDTNLSTNALNMYRAARFTLPCEDVAALAREALGSRLTGLSTRCNPRYLLEIVLDDLFLSCQETTSGGAVQALHQLRTEMAVMLRKNLQRDFLSFFPENEHRGSSPRCAVDEEDVRRGLESLNASGAQDENQLRRMVRSMKEMGIDPWKPALEKHILIETRRDRPAGELELDSICRSVASHVWHPESGFTPTKASIRQLLRRTVELCTRSAQHHPSIGSPECLRGKKLLEAVRSRGDATLCQALSVARPFEVVRPFFLSPAIASTECSSGVNAQEVGWEVYQACLLLIMLSAVKNLVFVPSTETEGDTVVVTHRASSLYSADKRDMNIVMVSE